MIIGISNGETYVASDVPAILKYTRNVYYIGNMEIAKLVKGSVTFYNIDREEIEKPLTEIKWDAEAAEKGGYEHFTSVISIGNRPLHGTKLFVSIAASRSRRLPIMRQPTTPAALQPKPIEMVSACLPQEPQRAKQRSRQNAARGR